MAMGIRDGEQSPLWIVTADLPRSPGHPFYARLNALLEAHDFDRFVEEQCQGFYPSAMGRPSLTPGRYFRLLLLGYFEGIDSERGIAWRATDSLAIRSFLGLGVQDAPPDHSTISRTRRLIDLETHRTVFTWVQQRLVDAGLLDGKTIAIDATTLEANAAMRSIVRRDTGESYQAFLTRLAQASGIETPTREDLAAAQDRTLRDVIDFGLKVLFVGINPGLYTAAIGASAAATSGSATRSRDSSARRWLIRWKQSRGPLRPIQ
jgi:transposase